MANTSTSTNNTDLYNAVTNQNELVNVEITRLDNLYSTNSREASFLLPKYQEYVSFNFYLWIIYYVLAMFCAYYMFYGTDHGIKRSTKILLCLLFAIFPMTVLSIELLLYKFMSYMYSVFSGNPYQLSTNNKPPFSILDIMPPGYY
jgi:SNF family Na+-dependent transporter